MVDWDRVEELKQKGWDWNRIAADPTVSFHPDSSVQQVGPALRRLYYRRQSRAGREAPAAPTKKADLNVERKWNIARVGFLITPIFGIWFLLAYLVPSPVGLLVAAVPWLAIGLAIGAVLLAFGLLRASKRWTKVSRNTLITGVVLGLVLSGSVALGGILLGCPYLPPLSSGTTHPDGWTQVGAAPWQQGGAPVFYFYGATWCPYCSASSWAMWKALSGFGSVTGTSTGYSSEGNIPEIVLANAQVASSSVAFLVTEDTSGVKPNLAGTSNCVQQAYVSAYSTGLPFVVINGQYIHTTSLIDPNQLTGMSTSTVQQQVGSASGTAWTIVQGQTWWMMAFVARSGGATPTNLAQQPYYPGWGNSAVWGSNTQSSVASDLQQIS